MWLSTLVLDAFAGSPLARARSRCVADEAACDELRFLLATRWARGEVGAGPQEPWRVEEILLLDGWRRATTFAAQPCLDEPTGCPFPVETHTVRVTARTDTVIAQLLVPKIDPGRPLPPTLPVALHPLGAGESLTLELTAFQMLSGDAELDGVSDDTAGAEPEPGCLSLVLDPTGRPAAGARVLTDDRVVSTGPDGLAPACGREDVAVLGDALAVRGDTWTLPLVAGARPRCSFEGAAPVPCDEVVLGHPERAVGWIEWGPQGPDGVIPVVLAPDGPVAERPPGVDWLPIGPVCARGGRLHRCTEAVTLHTVDDTGAPTSLRFTESGVFTDLSGRLVVWPDFQPTGQPYAVERRGDRLIVHGRPRLGPSRPKPSWTDWAKRDAGAMARAALAAVPVDARVPEGLELAPFPGGAVVSWRGRPWGLVGFADDHTAVLVGPPAGSRDRLIVEVGR